jgi:hypothetical protein
LGLIAFGLSHGRSEAFIFAVIAGVAPTAITTRLAAMSLADGSATQLLLSCFASPWRLWMLEAILDALQDTWIPIT